MSAQPVRADEDGDDDDSAAPSEATEATPEEPIGDEEAEEVAWTPSQDVATTFTFPDYPDKRLPIGEKITLLVGFANRGSRSFNLTHIGAALHSPFDYNYYIQNFTYREVNALVGPNEEASVEYTFTPDKSLEALEFHLSASLYYNDTDAGQFYRSTFINGTIELIEKSSALDAKTVFQYVLAFAGLGLAAYIGLNITGGLKQGSSNASERGTRAAAPSASQKEAVESSWAAPTFQRSAPKAVRKSAGKKRPSGKGVASPTEAADE